ncbi:PREDICTED: esterase-5B-like isoform X1 [Drosophila arizonae]|uniref:Carboxylic ester hydrolase n=1 Tax=Drosophila arizonae TaxID=7263 RepID=A0ABM1NNS2_DROAR|nr:PREDICTED: esterase-5B-like isoform X1 [Drosophila arizonae]
MSRLTLSICWLCLSLVWSDVAWADPLLVDISNGQLRGRDRGDYYSYESIPYAEPPIGSLRLEAPQPYKRQWSEVFDATKPPEFCLQSSLFLHGEIIGNEDCLTVSVYRPKNASRSSFPVMAYIHGGAFMFGGVMEYGHELIMTAGNFIMVKISYRLGPLGFLSAGDADLPGNFGLKDQRLALQWIKENIASFGGEPKNVMLMGHSAGGASVHYQQLHGGLEGMVKVAVSLSGSALCPWATQSDERQKAFKLGHVLECNVNGTSLELKRCLQSKDPRDIVGAVKHFMVFGYVPVAPFGPVVEAADTVEPFLTQQPAEAMKSGEYSQIPWLLSYTLEEGGFNAALFLEKSDEDDKELIEVLNMRWNELAPDLLFYRHTINNTEDLNRYSQELKYQYLGDRNFSFDSYLDLQRMFSDILFKNPIQRTLELTRSQRKSPFYCYAYDNPPDFGVGHWLSGRTDVFLGTVHCDDLYLMLNSAVHENLRSDEQIISKNFLQMLLDFVESEKGLLTYDTCQFKDIAGQGKMELVYITREGCENKQVEKIP